MQRRRGSTFIRFDCVNSLEAIWVADEYRVDADPSDISILMRVVRSYEQNAFDPLTRREFTGALARVRAAIKRANFN